MAGQVGRCPLLDGGGQPGPQSLRQPWIGRLQLGQGGFHRGGRKQGLQGRPGQALQGRQGGEHLGAAVGQVVVGMEDAARQLDQLALVAE